MKKTTENLILLNCVFVACLIIANISAAKVVSFWGLVIPAAIVCYPITYLITDVIGEIWGKDVAKKTVKIGLICQVLSLILIGLAILTPVAPFASGFQEEFSNVLSQSFRVVFASLVAYYISQFNDVYIFHKLKAKTDGKHKWIRNNASTMLSQIIDTSIFITIAFIGTVPNIWVMILSQYLIKVLCALLDTPFFYALTKSKKETRYTAEYNQNLHELQ